MKKKSLNLRKFFALLLSCLILVSAGSMVKVSASGQPTPAQQEDVKAAITKEIQMPAGVAKPKGKVTFQFAQADASKDPALDNIVIDLPGTPTETTTGTTTSLIYEVQLDQISTAVGKAFAGKSAGVYEYTVTELQSGIDVTPEGKLTKQVLYSKASYKLQVQVANQLNAQGSPNGKVYIKLIKVTPLTTDDGGNVTNNSKVTPTPGGGNGNDFRFVNKYSTTVDNGGGRETTTAPFSIEKIVAGDEGDVNQAFEFTFSITRPDLIAEANPSDKFTYSIVTSTENGAGVTAQNSVTGTYGQQIHITLGHKDKLIVHKVYGGSKVTADETDPHGHTKKIEYTVGPTVKDSINNEILLGEGNAAVVTNTKNTSTNVGFFLDNAPIILLIVVASAAVVLFTFVNKKRKEQR